MEPDEPGGADVPWWTFRPAQNLSGSVYRCPLCDNPLPALSEHMLIAPEGDTGRRRHAHTECVAAARSDGRLPTIDEWKSSRPPIERTAWWRRLFAPRRSQG